MMTNKKILSVGLRPWKDKPGENMTSLQGIPIVITDVINTLITWDNDVRDVGCVTMPRPNLGDHTNARMGANQLAFGPSIIEFVWIVPASDRIIAACTVCRKISAILNENLSQLNV